MDLRRALTPIRLAAVGLVILIAALVVLLTTNSNEYLLVPDRAHPLTSLVQVPGAKPERNGGGIYYVDVIEQKASLLERLFSGLRPKGATLVKHNQLAPPGVTDTQRAKADELDMQLSQEIASAVALRALGYDVGIRQDGVKVAIVYGNTHAVGKLRPGDVIVAADGTPVRSLPTLHNLIVRHGVGEQVRIAFLRNGVRHTVEIETTKDPFGQSRSIIGIQPAPAVKINAPFRIKFDLGGVGGPSAGLAFALEILEKRGRDVDHGYKVAATGEINPDGSVGAIGGVRQKVFGAGSSNVDVFLVPAGDNYREAKKYAHRLKLIPVKTFQQALRALATLPPKR